MALIQADHDALLAVAERISVRKEELAGRTVDRFREEVVGWASAEESELAQAREFTLRNIEALVGNLEHDEPLSEDLLASAREVAARRAHQGVTLEALLHQVRVLGETVWETVRALARLGRPEEQEAALQIAGRLWRHVDVLSTAMAHAYLDEITDRGLMGRGLLEALLTGQCDHERVRRLARTLHREPGENHVVVIVRGNEAPAEDCLQPPHVARVALDHIVEAARTHLRPSAASLVAGIRQGDVVAVYPTSGPEELDAVKRDCAALADALPMDVSIGMSGWHHGYAEIPTAYAEARDAVEIGAGMGIHDRAIVLDDVLVDHMLRASPHARRILRQTLQPLVEYDRARNADLVHTLRAYLEAGTNLTESARLLMVHANTVAYRLRRIRELSGRDPHDMDDLQILFLALKLTQLSSGPSSRA